MNKDEKNEKLAQIARRIEEHGFRANGNAIFNSIREAWNLGHKAGYNDGRADGFKEGLEDKAQYKQGQNDAWEIAKRIVVSVDDGGFSIFQLKEVFGTRAAYEVFMKYSLQECKEKIGKFDRRIANASLKVGDIVKVDDSGRIAVINGWTCKAADVMFADGTYGLVEIDNCTKIGSLKDMEANHEDR